MSNGGRFNCPCTVLVKGLKRGKLPKVSNDGHYTVIAKYYHEQV